MGPEAKIQRKIMDYLKTLRPYGFFFKVPQGKYAAHGVSDIVGCYHGRFLSFEVKAPTGVLSALQESFIKNITQAEGEAKCVRSVDEVKAVIHSIDQIFYGKKLIRQDKS